MSLINILLLFRIGDPNTTFLDGKKSALASKKKDDKFGAEDTSLGW